MQPCQRAGHSLSEQASITNDAAKGLTIIFLIPCTYNTPCFVCGSLPSLGFFLNMMGETQRAAPRRSLV